MAEIVGRVPRLAVSGIASRKDGNFGPNGIDKVHARPVSAAVVPDSIYVDVEQLAILSKLPQHRRLSVLLEIADDQEGAFAERDAHDEAVIVPVIAPAVAGSPQDANVWVRPSAVERIDSFVGQTGCGNVTGAHRLVYSPRLGEAQERPKLVKARPARLCISDEPVDAIAGALPHPRSPKGMVHMWVRNEDDIDRVVKVSPAIEDTINICGEALHPIDAGHLPAASVDENKAATELQQDRLSLADVDEMSDHPIPVIGADGWECRRNRSSPAVNG